jgi:hypothetical protein
VQQSFFAALNYDNEKKRPRLIGAALWVAVSRCCWSNVTAINDYLSGCFSFSSFGFLFCVFALLFCGSFLGSGFGSAFGSVLGCGCAAGAGLLAGAGGLAAGGLFGSSFGFAFVCGGGGVNFFGGGGAVAFGLLTDSGFVAASGFGLGLPLLLLFVPVLVLCDGGGVNLFAGSAVPFAFVALCAGVGGFAGLLPSGGVGEPAGLAAGALFAGLLAGGLLELAGLAALAGCDPGL